MPRPLALSAISGLLRAAPAYSVPRLASALPTATLVVLESRFAVGAGTAMELGAPADHISRTSLVEEMCVRVMLHSPLQHTAAIPLATLKRISFAGLVGISVGVWMIAQRLLDLPALCEVCFSDCGMTASEVATVALSRFTALEVLQFSRNALPTMALPLFQVSQSSGALNGSLAMQSSGSQPMTCGA